MESSSLIGLNDAVWALASVHAQTGLVRIKLRINCDGNFRSESGRLGFFSTPSDERWVARSCTWLNLIENRRELERCSKGGDGPETRGDTVSDKSTEMMSTLYDLDEPTAMKVIWAGWVTESPADEHGEWFYAHFTSKRASCDAVTKWTRQRLQNYCAHF